MNQTRRQPKFVRAIEGKNGSVISISADGQRLIRTGGTPAWRTNNPGNLRKGTKSKKNGSIGVALGFAVFPDYKTGRDADRNLLTTTYLRTTLYNVPKHYSPEEDGNDVKRYRRLLKMFTGFDLSRTVRDLNARELEILLDAIQKIEGFNVGTEVFLGPAKAIVDVERDKNGRAVRYLIDGVGWLTDLQTVQGILSGEIDGVVAKRAGKSYVRTRPDSEVYNNLDKKGR